MCEQKQLKNGRIRMKQFCSTLLHKWFVLVAGFRVGNIPLWRLIVHDFSKFSLSEFFAYQKRFTFNDCPKEEWDRAWLHHIHKNPHHWDHWILNGKPLAMPETYIREMVADWLAASRSYAGSWDIQSWLDKELQKMNLHPTTKQILKGTLKDCGFIWPLK